MTAEAVVADASGAKSSATPPASRRPGRAGLTGPLQGRQWVIGPGALLSILALWHAVSALGVSKPLADEVRALPEFADLTNEVREVIYGNHAAA